MPLITIATGIKSDGSIAGKVMSFLAKLQKDDTLPGLHIEPIVGSVDPTVRTGRVDKFWRAVLFKRRSEKQNHYIYFGTFPHDDAIEIARKTKLRFNLKLGAPEFAEVTREPAPKHHYHPPYPQSIPTPESTPTAEPTPTPEPTASQHATHVEEVASVWENIIADSWDAPALVDIGIDEQIAHAVLAASTQVDFMKVVENAPITQSLVLLGLSVGESIEEIREDLGLQPAEEETDELLDAGIKRQTYQFAEVGDDPEALEAALETKDIERWRTFLHPEQVRYVEGSWNGSYRISGGAGTGKTVVLLHRANALVRRDREARILLTTFTRTLAESLEVNMRKLAPEVRRVSLGQSGLAIMGIDQTASAIITTAHKNELAQATEKVLGWRASHLKPLADIRRHLLDAVNMAAPTVDEELLNPTFLEQEYVSVVLGHEVSSAAEYARAPRTGRGTPLNRAKRLELWKVFAQFRRANEYYQQATFPEMAAVAARILNARAERGEARPCDHVLIDEGQDFHAAHWRLVRALAAVGPDDLFIAEDSNQRIYGQKLTLSKYGIEIRGRARRLRLNYRTTVENLAFAVSLLDGGDITDLEGAPETVSDYRSILSGPRPRIITAENIEKENAAVIDQLNAWTERGILPEAIGLLARTRDRLTSLGSALSEAGIGFVTADGGAKVGSNKVSLMTMHRAKGMEFQCVIVVGIGPDQIPASWAIDGLPEQEKADAKQREDSLLYVAATRARDELVLTRVG